jgi:phthalate 4,5-dioxygenase
MLTQAENELLTRVGPDTPMGTLLRQYWQPVLLASELPERDGPPLRVRLLGEDLVAFRDSSGQVGLLGAHCAHRGAPLSLGRNEEGGLRCVYHGWKYDVQGRCVDMPNVPPESDFKHKVRQQAYRCVERNGIIWACLAPDAALAEPPELDFTELPANQVYIGKQYLECNWVQGLEGDFDPSHSSFLHASLDPNARQSAGGTAALEASVRARVKHAVIMTAGTDRGLLVGARREAESDSYYWRFNEFVFPFYAFVPTAVGSPLHCNAWTPIDDTNTMVWRIDYRLDGPFTEQQLARLQSGLGSTVGRDGYLPPGSEAGAAWRPRQHRGNDYLIDWEAQRAAQFCGVRGVWAQDKAVTEGMGPIYDRSQEHLGPSDVGIIQLRQTLLGAAKGLQQGTPPPGLQARVAAMRSPIEFLPRGLSWEEVAQHVAEQMEPAGRA